MDEDSIDLKVLAEIRQFLHKANIHSAPKTGGKPAQRPVIGGCFSYSSFPVLPKNAMDEVFPGIWLGDTSCAQKPSVLKLMEITHVVNVSMGTKFNQTNTSSAYYEPHDICFHGIPAHDIASFKMYPYLHSAADFIDEALSKNGKVYVHCQQGVSRSATVVVGFLMLKRSMSVLSAIKFVRQKREIFPNEGFIKQLCQLHHEILSGR